MARAYELSFTDRYLQHKCTTTNRLHSQWGASWGQGREKGFNVGKGNDWQQNVGMTKQGTQEEPIPIPEKTHANIKRKQLQGEGGGARPKKGVMTQKAPPLGK